jgi:hypothetical protein
MKNWLSYHWLKLLAIVMAMIAAALAILSIALLPYAYYQFMNWVILLAGLTTAKQAHERDRDVLLWLAIFAAILFNPVAPFYFGPAVWALFDLLVAFLFFISIVLLRPKR